MHKEIVDAPKDKLFPKVYYHRKFAKIGKDLDQKLEIGKDIVAREAAAMDAINDVFNELMIGILKSFIPTIGIDCNVTLEKKIRILKQRFKWTCRNDEKMYAYLRGLLEGLKK